MFDAVTRREIALVIGSGGVGHLCTQDDLYLDY